MEVRLVQYGEGGTLELRIDIIHDIVLHFIYRYKLFWSQRFVNINVWKERFGDRMVELYHVLYVILRLG